MLTAFGSAAVGFMFVTYWLEGVSRWFVALFAVGCAASSLYAWLAGAYPFTVVEGLWALVAFRRFQARRRRDVLANAG